MSTPTPSFGTRIRAARLGWGHAPRHGCFIRMVDVGEGRNRIELCPTNGVPVKKSKGGLYRCWWETPEVLDLIPWLSPIRAIRRYVSVIVDNEGSVVEAETR